MPNASNGKNPRDGASALSIVFFWWMNDVLRLGNKLTLTDQDLFPLLEDHKSEELIAKAEKMLVRRIKRASVEKQESPFMESNDQHNSLEIRPGDANFTNNSVFELRLPALKEMAIIRLKGFIVSVLVVLYFTTLPIAVLISVTTLVFAGTQLSSFTIFTVLLGLVTIRFTCCNNLGLAVQIVADGKIALDRIQAFIQEKVSKFDEIEQHQRLSNEQVNSLDNILVQDKTTKKTIAAQLTNYRKRDDSAGSNSQTFTSNSTATSTPNIFSNITAEVPLQKSEDQLQHLKDLDHIAVMENGSITHQGGCRELTNQGVFSDIFELSGIFVEDPGRVRSATLYEFNEKGNIMMVMNRPRSITTVSVPNRPRSISTISVLNRPRSITSVSGLRGHGLELPDFQEDDILSVPRVRLIAGNVSPKRIRSVSLHESNKKEIINAHKPSYTSASFLNGQEGKDNLAFSVDCELAKLQDCGGDSNIDEDSTPQFAYTSVSEADQRPALDMKEEEETLDEEVVNIRICYCKRDIFFANFSRRYQDENTQAFFMVVSSTRWLTIRLDLLSSLFITIVAVAAILLVENPALAGLALTYALQNPG
ncbi:hypothetical protein OS493_031319 [Desmophyllum pertusum]|uniref:Uncharacterized protein n=1 Tax=Desmophyllum pertusum TaxID=174260 RepID=A0A9W9YYX3_9CNID|nr:hypothetical protein OS493_031319 [Desmophyllum pertusum]